MTICAVTVSTTARSLSASRPRRDSTRASSDARISSASARSDAIAGTTASDACQARKRSASAATIRSAWTASARRPSSEADDDRLEVVDVVDEAAVDRRRATDRRHAGRRGRRTAPVGRGARAVPAVSASAVSTNPGALVDETTTSASRERLRHVLERAARGRRATRQSLRPVDRAVDDRVTVAPRERRLRAVSSLVLPAPTSTTRRPSSPSKTCCASAAAAAGTDAGLSPIAVSTRARRPGVERHPERPVEQRARRAGLERVAHLPEDLPLARDERVEPGGDAEQVQRGRLVGEPVRDRSEGVGVRARQREQGASAASSTSSSSDAR